MLFGLVVASKIFLDSKIQMAIKRKNTKMQYFKDLYNGDMWKTSIKMINMSLFLGNRRPLVLAMHATNAWSAS